MQAFFQLYLANVKEFVRDRMAMFWTLAFPIMFILIFGIIFSGSGGTTFEVGLAVDDQGPVGDGLRQIFHRVEAFEISEGESDELLAQLKRGDLRVVVVVPEGVSEAVAGGRPVCRSTTTRRIRPRPASY